MHRLNALHAGLFCLGMAACVVGPPGVRASETPDAPADASPPALITPGTVAPVDTNDDANVDNGATEREKALAARRQQRETDLRELEQAIALSGDQTRRLEDEINGLRRDRETLNGELVEAATRSRRLEEELLNAEAHLDDLGLREDRIRVSLQERRALLAQVLAALQRMGRNPPPALLVGPSDALESVRSAILMGAVVPEMRDEANALLADLTELRDLAEAQKKARENFATALRENEEERQRMALLVEEKRKLEEDTAKKLAEERARAETLAGRAKSVNELITALETEIEAARKARIASQKAETERKKREKELLAKAEIDRKAAEKDRQEDARKALADTARLAPAIAFSRTRGTLSRPAVGVEVKAFGASSESLDQTQGILIATRAGATIVTPADAWVVYAGKYRSFGQLVILNVGDDHHIVMAGMKETDINIGQFVLAGEPVGRMGQVRLASAASLDVRSKRPLLYVEFRHKGNPVDPSPWWRDNLTGSTAATNKDKSSG